MSEDDSSSQCDAAGCSSNGQHVCGGCHVTRYCSKSCQRLHWKTGGHKYECKVSSLTHKRALAQQDSAIDNNDGDYFVFELPEVIPTSLDTINSRRIRFQDEIMKAVFYLLRQRALHSPYCVWRMYTMIKQEKNDLALRNQLSAEYGVDPFKAKNAPPVGEITEEDFTLIRQTLRQGQEEARLLLAQPPPNEALARQDAFLSSEEAIQNNGMYIIFDSERDDVALGFGIPAVRVELFKILRKRASISPRCLILMHNFIKFFLIGTLEDPVKEARLNDLMQKQLPAEYGMDPISAAGQSKEFNDVCESVAQYVSDTISLIGFDPVS